MMYTVLHTFYDLEDNQRLYNAGDQYPRAGYTPTPQRIAELASTQNKLEITLIEAVQEKGEGITAQQQKPAKKAPRSRKTEE